MRSSRISRVLPFVLFVLFGPSACDRPEPPSAPPAAPALPASPALPAVPASPTPAAPSGTALPAVPTAPAEGAGAPSKGGTVAVNWSFPALISDPTRGLVFPTYMAHLLGRPLEHPFPTDLVCLDITNPGPAFSATVTIKMAIYAADASENLVAAPGHTHHCLTPAFDLAKLYELRAATPGRIEAGLSVGGAVVSQAMEPLSISPVDEIAWRDGAISFDDMRALAPVFVTPADPRVDQLQRVAASGSVFGRFGNGDDAYERDPYLRSADLDPQTWSFEAFAVEAGEPVAWTLPSVSGGNGVVDVYLFTPDQYDAWQNGDARDATEVWANQPSGASGRVSEPPGVYMLVVFSTETYAPVSVSWSRNVTREDVAVDTLQAIYGALQALHTRYSDISSSFFDGFQHVRRPSEALDALSANCLEGSLLFASTLELIGMKPVLVFRTGHAYVAVQSAPGSKVLWPVETTMVGTDDFSAAFGRALDELDADSQNDTRFELVDVAAARAHGIMPLAQ
jgi:hypothetical protein